MDSSLEPSERGWPCPHLDLGLPTSGAVREHISIVLSPPICGTFLRPEDPDPGHDIPESRQLGAIAAPARSRREGLRVRPQKGASGCGGAWSWGSCTTRSDPRQGASSGTPGGLLRGHTPPAGLSTCARGPSSAPQSISAHRSTGGEAHSVPSLHQPPRATPNISTSVKLPAASLAWVPDPCFNQKADTKPQSLGVCYCSAPQPASAPANLRFGSPCFPLGPAG